MHGLLGGYMYVRPVRDSVIFARVSPYSLRVCCCWFYAECNRQREMLSSGRVRKYDWAQRQIMWATRLDQILPWDWKNEFSAPRCVFSVLFFCILHAFVPAEIDTKAINSSRTHKQKESREEFIRSICDFVINRLVENSFSTFDLCCFQTLKTTKWVRIKYYKPKKRYLKSTFSTLNRLLGPKLTFRPQKSDPPVK